uniref:Uncharacterized protein n=1 Tax=Prolemur simus TaxID=1328070 RepID=A0A8C9AQT9_PROSS
MRTSSPGVKDLDPPLAVVHHHDPPCLGTQRQPGGVDQGPPAAEGVETHLLKTSGVAPYYPADKWQSKKLEPSLPTLVPSNVSNLQCWVLGVGCWVLVLAWPKTCSLSS